MQGVWVARTRVAGGHARRGTAIRAAETSGSRLVTQFLGSIIAFYCLGDNRAGRVPFREVLTLGLYDAGDVATRQCDATHAE